MVDWMREMLWRVIRGTGVLHDTLAGQVLDVGKEPAQPALDALESGFELLAHFNPQALRRVEKACARYVLFDRGQPEYWTLPRVIFLGKEELTSWNNGAIALTLIHEATHARLEAWGLTPARFGHDRIEKACIRRERAVAATFPNSEQWIDWVDAKAATRWWARGKSAKRIEDEFAGAGASRPRRWLVRWIARWATRNHPAD